jgi:hypothetical protein
MSQFMRAGKQLWMAGIVVLLVVSAAICDANSGLRAAQPVPVPPQQTERIAEQVYKNVQVFKGLPATEFIKAIQFMAASLGVFCDHCHVTSQQGNWPMEKDDKQAKQTARKMIAMTRAINETNFADRTVVTCTTCHQGHTTPVGVPPVRALDAHLANLAAQAQQNLPTAEQVLDRYVEVLGGRPALEKLTTRQIGGSVITEGARNFPIQISQTANKYLLVIHLPRGDQFQAFNGTVGWGKFPGNQWTMQGLELARLARAAEFYNAFDLKARFPRLVLKGKERIGEQEAYVVIASSASGGEGLAEMLYFDVASGLLLRRIVLTQTPLGEFPEQTNFFDYRQVDGVKLPFTVERIEINTRWTEKYTEVKHNVVLDGAVFEPPPAEKK